VEEVLSIHISQVLNTEMQGWWQQSSVRGKPQEASTRITAVPVGKEGKHKDILNGGERKKLGTTEQNWKSSHMAVFILMTRA
jgi:hypothetical protein